MWDVYYFFIISFIIILIPMLISLYIIFVRVKEKDNQKYIHDMCDPKKVLAEKQKFDEEYSKVRYTSKTNFVVKYDDKNDDTTSK